VKTTRAVRRATYNPLACSDTLMRPNTLLMAKLSWLLLVVGGYWQAFLAPVIPGLSLLANVPGGTAWLAGAFWLGGVCLLLNRVVRVASVAIAISVLLLPFESVTAWHPYAWICGGVLLLCGLQGPGDEPRFVRWFLILVHCAAALGTIGGAGWIATALAAPWNESDFVGVVPRWIEGFLPPGDLARALYWGSLTVCVTIPLGLLVPRLRRPVAALALLFYTVLYVALGSTELALFAGAIAIAQISCVPWPRFVLVVWPRSCGWPLALRMALDRYDFERRTDWPRPPDPDAELEAWFDLHPVAGAKAIVDLVLCFPVFYFALLAMLSAAQAALPRFAAVTFNSVIVLSLLGFSAFAALSALGAWVRKRPPPPLPKPEAGASATPENAEPAQQESASAPAADVTDVTVEIDTPPPPDR
jgi:hypothetical protein